MLIHKTIIEQPGIQKRILAFADLQYDQNFSLRKLQSLKQQLIATKKQESIDYIFILGDTINSLNVLENPTIYRRLLDFFHRLAEQTPVIMVLGNHDTYYFDKNHHLHITPTQIYQQYLHDLDQIPDFHLLHTDDEQAPSIFDDGTIRVLGLSLPAACYFEQGSAKNPPGDGQSAFNELIKKYLPELTKVPKRNYYLLTHSPAYLQPGLIPANITVLAGHNHHGLVPPLLDELTRFTSRGLVGPGLTYLDRRGTKYELFPRNARLRPTSKQPWLTLRPITYFSDRILRPFNIFYPELSFAIIREDQRSKSSTSNRLRLTERYSIVSRRTESD